MIMKVPMREGLLGLGLGPMGGSVCEASWSVGLVTEVKDPVTLCVFYLLVMLGSQQLYCCV